MDGPHPHNVLNTEEIVHVSKSNYVKNKILDDKPPMNFSAPKLSLTASSSGDEDTQLAHFLGKTTIIRPLTYPYTSVLPPSPEPDKEKSIKQFHVIQKYARAASPKLRESPKPAKDRTRVSASEVPNAKVNSAQTPLLKVNDAPVLDGLATDLRKRKLSYEEFERPKQPKTDEVIDLSMPAEKAEARFNGDAAADEAFAKAAEEKAPARSNGYVVLPMASDVSINYVIQEGQANGDSPKYKAVEYDNSAMETLADIATKQVKLEKNTLAKSVASEYLKIATKNEAAGDGGREANAFGRVNQEVNDLLVRPEGNKSCHICAKSFSKAPQLR